MKIKNIYLILILFIFLIIIISGAYCYIKYLSINSTSLTLKKETADLDNNLERETYLLENGRLTITETNKLIWQSPPDWKIDNFVLADSNNDELIDINLSVWKPGNFGSSKPFWIKENDPSIKNHFFIFNYINGSLKAVWQSSNLEVPNCQFTIKDIDRDGKNDLLVIEGNYDHKNKCEGTYLAIWKWNGWGFSNDWRGKKGNFSNIIINDIIKY
jgi:poly-gamma-glutamate synthesis protein (capsule biosynthesis protein)